MGLFYSVKQTFWSFVAALAALTVLSYLLVAEPLIGVLVVILAAGFLCIKLIPLFLVIRLISRHIE